MTNPTFQTIEKVDSIKKVIKNLFDVDLNVSGGWGYDEKSATVVESLDDAHIEQFLHMFASIRANIEMNATLDEEERYGGINLTFKEKKTLSIDKKTYTIVTFTISAMKENDYAKFIKEYKENYGKKEFDLTNHFKKRKEHTLSREVDYWFDDLDFI